ncbi:hypothetical protein AAHH67_10695 [Niallia circulans]
MRLEVTVCHSIIEKCFEGFTFYQKSNRPRLLLEEILNRRIILHPELEQEYYEYFSNEKPELLDQFMEFYSNIIIQEENSKMISSYVETYQKNDKYTNLLLNICNTTEDKILLTESRNEIIQIQENIDQLEIIDSVKMLDRNDCNSLNNYRLPIIRKVVQNGESSAGLSKWMSKFIKTEDKFIIIDNYIYKNRYRFRNYFLKYVKPTAEIEIYTLLPDGMSETDIINAFKGSHFKNWNIVKIIFIKDKKEQHARDIITDQYYIEIDKGMRVFGVGGQTEQSNITISYKNDIFDQSIPQYV